MSYNYFFIRTPIQYYNALEAIQYFNSHNGNRLIVISDYPPSIEQIEKLIDRKIWSDIYMPWRSQSKYTKYKVVNKLFNITRPLLLGRIVRKIKTKDKIFWGNYNSIWLRYFLTKKRNKVTVLDDGFATLSIPETLKNDTLFFKTSKGISGVTERIFVSKSASIPLKRLEFFTSFKNIAKAVTERSISCEYNYLKTLSKTIQPLKKEVYFIGQPLILLSLMSKESYIKQVDLVFNYYKNKGLKCYYIPHRSALHDYFPKNWDIVYFNFPLENLVLQENHELPEIFASFYSSALYYVNKFSSIDGLKFEFWKSKDFDGFSNVVRCFEYIKKENLNNTTIHKIDC